MVACTLGLPDRAPTVIPHQLDINCPVRAAINTHTHTNIKIKTELISINKTIFVQSNCKVLEIYTWDYIYVLHLTHGLCYITFFLSSNKYFSPIKKNNTNKLKYILQFF